MNGDAEPIDVEIVDYRQCFDSMWLSENLNDLFESGIQDDNLALINAANAKNYVAVQTPAGLTERVPRGGDWTWTMQQHGGYIWQRVH